MTDIITELEELDARKVSAVGAPANGTPWLLLKAAEEGPTEGAGAHSEEADEIEAELTKAGAAGFCGLDDCEVCKQRFGPLHEMLMKKRLRAKERHALPDSDFAIPEKRAYPIHDESHARNALARVSQFGTPSEKKRVRAAVRRKYPDIKVSGGKAKKGSPGVPAFATATPKEHGHFDSGRSGLGSNMTAGIKHPHDDPSFALGGESTYNIPLDHIGGNAPAPPQRIRPNGDAIGKGSWAINVVEKDNWMAQPNPAAQMNAAVGSPAWENFDAATLDSVSRGLAAAARAVDCIAKREVTEAIAGKAKDWFDAFQLDCAKQDIYSALALVASLAYQEHAEAAKEQMSEQTWTVLSAALTSLSGLFGEATKAGRAGSSSEEEEIMTTTVTKEELAQTIATSVTKAMKRQAKRDAQAAKKAAKKAAKLARKNANNGGDITAAEENSQVRGVHDAEDVEAVGGKVKPEYVNKSKKLTKLAKELESVKDLLSKAQSRPRSGGPVLDGVARGAVQASEGRLGTASKGAGDSELERLEKAMEDAEKDHGPLADYKRQEIGEKLTLARLRAHAEGRL